MWLYYIWIQIPQKKKMCVYIYILNSTCVGVRACVRAWVSVWVSGWMWVWMCGCVISLWPISHTYHVIINLVAPILLSAISFGKTMGSYRSWSGQSVRNLCYRTVDPSQLGHCDPHVPGSYQALDSWQLWRVELLKWHLKMKMEIRPFQKPPNIRMKAIV
jgi:hypothetical protein